MIKRDKNDTEALVKRFNKNRLNGKITLKEFMDELTTKAPTKTYY